VLYVKGDLRPEGACAIAVVGSRHSSTYGRLTAERLGEELAARGVTVVSGLARGIDAAAHRGALKVVEGRTIAVFGCGINQVYPSQHAGLAAQVAGQGALISEFPIGTKPLAANFPRRNRIISGLSLGVVVVEAPTRSGALITARTALDQGREVFAVPGHAGSYTSRGTHSLIKDGAKLVDDVDDILDELPALRSQSESSPIAVPVTVPNLSEEESRVMDQLSRDPRYIDQICLACGLDSAQVLQVLLGLELKGIVRQLQGQMYVRQV
jgi:DNA processing protein